jgi:hypothetical protein
MSKYIITFLLCSLTCATIAQDNNRFSYKPFSIYKSLGQVVIAGNVNTHVYKDYYGKNVAGESYSDAHARPEYLVYELFKNMKSKNINAIAGLYDSSFRPAAFDANNMTEFVKDYSDIKFASKFRSGDNTVVRYDFYASQNKRYPYFAMVREMDGKFFLTMDINISDPFNLVGSYSPNNLFEKAEENINTKNLTAFYFVRKDSKVFFTPEQPNEDYAAIYFAFEYFNNAKTPESDFLQELQQVARSGDSVKLKSMIVASDLSLLSDPYYANYYYGEIKKIFMGYPNITPVAALKTSDGKILYFRFSNNDQSSFIASVILKQVNRKYYLALKMTNDDLTNILQNVYVRETLINHFSKR